MRTLYLIRHAKSSWHDQRLTDPQRPLNNRGQRDAPKVGQTLHHLGIRPDLVLASTAERVSQTLDLLLDEWPALREAEIEKDEALYMASAESLLLRLRAVPDEYHSVALIGHNPGLLDLLNFLCGFELPNLPTMAIAGMRLATSEWSHVEGQQATLQLLITPKGL